MALRKACGADLMSSSRVVPAVISRLQQDHRHQRKPQSAPNICIETQNMTQLPIQDGLEALKKLHGDCVFTSDLQTGLDWANWWTEGQMKQAISGENALRLVLQLDEMDLHQPIAACHSEWKTHEQ